MFNPRALARTLLAGIFVVGGWDSFQNPKAKASAAEQAGVPIAEKLGLDTTDPAALVRMNGITQLVGGLLLALGWLPRLAAVTLGATLVPTTLGAHRFWEIEDAQERKLQSLQALKNASILGGLVMTALDHGGRPSVFWATRKAADKAADAMGTAVDRVTG